MIIEKAGFNSYLPFLLGALAGIIVVLIVASKGSQKNYDERQLVARGDAFKWGFITALAYIGISEVITMLFGEWIETSTNLAFGISLPAMAFGIACVVKGAYIGLKQNYKSVLITNFIICILNISMGIMTTAENGWKFIADGRFTMDVRIIIGFALLAMTLTLLISNHISKKNEVDYEES